ncbi:hypothetical protein ABIC74_000763 [Mucilaginibacter rubeus]|uniref:hypothetical protein n=1 Tax=Mucilaginibacter rubeus TaxID=2027860 RepID=UPI0033935A85
MKTETLKLKSPKTTKVYGYVKLYTATGTTQQSQNTDPTTTCTTVFTTTHIFKV